jgi:hypothetical protein
MPDLKLSARQIAAKNVEAMQQMVNEAGKSFLEPVVADIARHLPPQQNGPACNVAPNGEPYDVVKSFDGIFQHQNPLEAVKEWRERLLAYVATHRGDIIWWRTRPEIAAHGTPGKTGPVWAVYSRLAIGTPFIEQVKRGERAATTWDVQGGLITQEEIDGLGLVIDISTGEYRKPVA